MLTNKIKDFIDNLNTYGKILLFGILTIIILTIIALILGGFTGLGYIESFRIFFGSVYVLFLPGFVLSFIFFPKTKKFDEEDGEHGNESEDRGLNGKGSIDWIERIALSFALSIAVVPLAVFYLNLIGLRINALNSALTILGIITIAVGILIIRKNKEK